MIKGCVNFMIAGMCIILLAAYYYCSENEEKIRNKFVLSVNKSYLFNWAPMIGLAFIVLGEFIVWESQNNKELKAIKVKIIDESRLRLSLIKFDLLQGANKIF